MFTIKISCLHPLLCQKAKKYARKMGKDNFVVTDGWVHHWTKRKNTVFNWTHGEYTDPDFKNSQKQEFFSGFPKEGVIVEEGFEENIQPPDMMREDLNDWMATDEYVTISAKLSERHISKAETNVRHTSLHLK